MTASKVPSAAAMKAAKLIEDYDTAPADVLAQWIDAAFAPLRDENARLRKALQDVDDLPCGWSNDVGHEIGHCCLEDAHKITAAALATAEQKGEG